MKDNYRKSVIENLIFMVLGLFLLSACSNRKSQESTGTLSLESGSTSSDANLNFPSQSDLFSNFSLPTTATDPTPVTSSEASCLANDIYDGQSTSSCLNSSAISTSTANTDSQSDVVYQLLLGQAVKNFQFMDQCYQVVANRRPTSTDSAAVTAAFEAAQVAMIRCYQWIHAQTAQTIPWENTQQGQLQNNNQAYFSLLMFLLSQNN